MAQGGRLSIDWREASAEEGSVRSVDALLEPLERSNITGPNVVRLDGHQLAFTLIEGEVLRAFVPPEPDKKLSDYEETFAQVFGGSSLAVEL